MKQTLLTLSALAISIHSFADYWTQEASFGGTARHAAAGFFLNGKGYIGTGGTFMSPKGKDFWEWNPSANVWSQMADFGGTGRSGAVGFAIGNLGYIATGTDNSPKKDMYAYDPSSNTWTQKADFGGAARHFATGFELNGKGYIGTGTAGGNFNDFWEYDPATDSWTQKANFGGTARSSCASFSVNGKGYIGIGFGTSSALSDFWEYDPSTNTWTQKAAFGGGKRSDAVGFSVCDKGYFATGTSGGYKNDIWEYDPIADTWTQKTNFGGNARSNAVGFCDGTYGYIGTGTNTFNEFDDFWKYSPDCLVLPIGLTSFSVTPQGNKVLIRWSTATEFTNGSFAVQRSLDGIHFQLVTVIEESANTEAPNKYEATDESPFTGLNYYRLLQTDNNGQQNYSNVLSCRVSGTGMMSVFNVTPNPVQSSIDIVTDLSDDEPIHIRLLNSSGMAIVDEIKEVNEDIQHTILDVSGLKAGVYFLHIQCEYGNFSQKLMKL